MLFLPVEMVLNGSFTKDCTSWHQCHTLSLLIKTYQRNIEYFARNTVVSFLSTEYKHEVRENALPLEGVVEMVGAQLGEEHSPQLWGAIPTSKRGQSPHNWRCNFADWRV